MKARILAREAGRNSKYSRYLSRYLIELSITVDLPEAENLLMAPMAIIRFYTEIIGIFPSQPSLKICIWKSEPTSVTEKTRERGIDQSINEASRGH